MKKTINFVCVLAILFLIGVITYTGLAFYNEYKTLEEINLSKMENFVNATTQDISNDFIYIQDLMDEYVQKLSTNRFTKEEVQSIARNILVENEQMSGIAISFEPYEIDSSTRLFSAYFNRLNGEIQTMQLEEFYDYTDENEAGYDWYVLPLRNGKGWTEPYYGSASKELLVAYSSPFYDPDDSNKIIGVITGVYSLDQINNILASYTYDGSSYSYMFSQTGKLMVYPVKEYVIEGKTIDDVFGYDNVVENKDSIEAYNGKYFRETIDEITNDTSIFYYTQVSGTNFTIVNSFSKDEIQNGVNFKNKLMIISLLFIALLITGILLIFNIRGLKKNLVNITIIVSIILFAGIITILWIAITFSNMDSTEIKKMDTLENLNSLLSEETEKSIQSHIDPPIIIPTGLFIQSMEFESSNNVKLTGFLWQKYTNEQIENCEQGFIFPEAISFASELSYERTKDEYTTIGWYFETTLRQTFNYSRYPFDSKNVWIRIWHKEFDKNIILKPSLEDYSLFQEDALPGIENEIVLSGWNIEKTFFSYTNNSYNTNFGISNYVGTSDFPELYYTIMISREFTNPLISDFLPIIVILGLLFAIFVITSQDESVSSKFSISLSGTLGTSSALFFAVVLSHASLRERIPSENMLYMEYLYIVAYVGIVFMVIDSFAVYYKKQWKFFSYEDNLLPKLIYWPIILLVMLFCTVNAFYIIA